ncbi:hypothetical protein SYJ56_19290 [Algoriphagus sp. D3-2-R+10]|uniref:hypothetical protein n=1 Tax=Algoriphagus aurantiacus TaxID=3103948 RepID=UPI002B36ABA1|nr:hypothetical protein [Algoriphagus sp. D3-2-R+10]MEB2777468.1 hypothetical protein [Algoriphagus sp. D3-2-R+10]
MTKTALFFLFLLPLNALAQKTEAEVLQLLNHGSEKTWLYEGTEIIMKGSDQCDNGKYYSFRSDKKVVIGDCIHNGWKLVEESYSLRKETSVDWYLTIGKQEFYLVMTEIPAYDEIKLRKFDGRDKADPALDIKLKFLKDD